MGNKTRKSLYLGIDLGTTNSKAAVLDYRGATSGQLRPLGLRQYEDFNRQTTWEHLPSVVRFDTDGRRVFVGEYPRRYLIQFPDTTIRAVKRLMGKNWRHSVPGWPMPWTPEAISALILKHIRTQALEQMHDTLDELASVAVSIPASFGDRQREATKEAARLAGFDGEISLIDEPSAALIHYLYDRWQQGDEFKPETKVMVFDVGGGTLDVSLAEVRTEDGNKGLRIRVISRSRYTELAGIEFDLRLAAYIINRLKAHGFNMPQSEQGRTDLFRAALFDYAEKLKIRMSEELDKLYRWHYVVDGLPFDESYKNIKLSISPRVRDINLDGRTVQLPDIPVPFDDFEAVLAPFFEEPQDISDARAGTGTVYGPILTALQEANLTKEDVDLVLLHGGMTKLPLIKACVAQYFPLTTRIDSSPDPMTSVAQGAAIYQASRDGRETNISLEEPILFESIFLEQDKGFQLIIEKNSSAGRSGICQLVFNNGAQNIVLSFYHGFSATDLLLTHDRTFQISLPQPLTDNQTLSLRWTVQADRTVTYEYQSPFSDSWQPLKTLATKSVSHQDNVDRYDQLRRVMQSVETC